MAIESKEVREKLALVSGNVSLLDMMLEFERMLDNINLYAYKNWLLGELIDGPTVERYWLTCKFMYPHKLMPDPMGGMRLEKFGCKVSYEKSTFKSPVKVTSPDSYKDMHTKQVKLKEMPVWVITIQMPRKFIDERIIDDVLTDDVHVNTGEIEEAYDESMDYDGDV